MQFHAYEAAMAAMARGPPYVEGATRILRVCDVMELGNTECHLARALVAVGVARPGLTRIGTEPMRVPRSISQMLSETRTPLRLLYEYKEQSRPLKVCVFCDPNWIGWYCKKFRAQY